ncbi:TetR/AcrR family transcriptional regulator [Pontibacter mangrovi]|uniref:TetR/AcrR family transcriptional regulator n=1 Tax=Pontibacter mangrovi TaxID=2589816 RepID=A0A501W6K1_9BACT|nr:TetR/AcrR family transcriptional regulator [Pontibacter mangrovi]TPE44265.1 TetR/AcrR family transcriptional regulator [Pontibacter mangrovi]
MSTKKSKKLDLILEEAAKLFKQKGFAGTSMRDLAERIGIDAASMYHYISSKDEILRTICYNISTVYISQLAEIEQKQATYTQKLKDLVRLHIRVMVTRSAEVSVTNNDWKYLAEDSLQQFKARRKEYERGVAALLEKGVAAGEFEALDTSVALFTILSAVRWVELWWRPERGITPDELENAIITILFKGLEKTHHEHVS